MARALVFVGKVFRYLILIIRTPAALQCRNDARSDAAQRHAAVLAAVNLADQLCKAQDGSENLRRQLKTYLDEASQAKSEAAELRRKLQNQQNQNRRG